MILSSKETLDISSKYNEHMGRNIFEAIHTGTLGKHLAIPVSKATSRKQHGEVLCHGRIF